MRNEVKAWLVGQCLGRSIVELCLEADWRGNRPLVAKHHDSHLSNHGLQKLRQNNKTFAMGEIDNGSQSPC